MASRPPICASPAHANVLSGPHIPHFLSGSRRNAIITRLEWPLVPRRHTQTSFLDTFSAIFGHFPATFRLEPAAWPRVADCASPAHANVPFPTLSRQFKKGTFHGSCVQTGTILRRKWSIYVLSGHFYFHFGHFLTSGRPFADSSLNKTG